MESEKSTPRLNGVARLVLGTFTTIHCLLHVVLFVTSSIAWSTMLKLAKDIRCASNGGVDCGFLGWLFYSFITPTALICAIVLAVLAIRTWAATKGAPFNPLYIFRGLVFTTLLLTPFIYFGWSSSRFALDWIHLPGI